MDMWEEYARQIETDIERIKADLAPLEAREMHLRERKGDGPWQDVTQQWIDRHKQNLNTYERILAAIKKRQAP